MGGLLAEGTSEAPPRWYGRGVWGVALVGLGLIAGMSMLSAWWMYDFWPATGAALGLAVVLLGRGRAGERLERLPAWAFLAAAAGLAAAVRAACVLLVPYLPSADFQVYHDAGVAMAESWTLGQVRGGSELGYRCFFPPGQVFALGVMYRLFNNSVLAGQMLNVAYGTLTVPGIWLLGRRMLGERAGRVAALLAAVLPSGVFGCMLLGAEVPETFWLVAALCVYVEGVHRRAGLAAGLLCGVLLGAASLIRPTFVLAGIPLGLHLVLSSPRRGWAAAAAGMIILGTAAAVAPWTVRNYRVTGGFILISSNGGGNLYSANNDLATGAYTPEAWQHVFDNSPDDLTLQRVGTRCAVEWIRAHPGRFLKLAVRKFVLFWHTDREIAWWALSQTHLDHPGLGIPEMWQSLGQSGSTGFYSVLLAAGAVGLWRHRRRLRAEAAWMAVPVLSAYFTAIHMVFEAQGKYHFMLVPLLCVLAGPAGAPAALNERR